MNAPLLRVSFFLRSNPQTTAKKKEYVLYYNDFKENASDTLLARVHGNDEAIQVTVNC